VLSPQQPCQDDIGQARYSIEVNGVSPVLFAEAVWKACEVLADKIVSDGETGLVVPAADADALAEAIVALAGDLPRAAVMGAAGRERALTEFTPERRVERVEQLYARALDPAPT